MGWLWKASPGSAESRRRGGGGPSGVRRCGWAPRRFGIEGIEGIRPRGAWLGRDLESADEVGALHKERRTPEGEGRGGPLGMPGCMTDPLPYPSGSDRGRLPTGRADAQAAARTMSNRPVPRKMWVRLRRSMSR